MNSKNPVLSMVIVAVVLSLFTLASSFAQEAAYVGNKQCKMCHNKAQEGQIWNAWSAMKHANAYKALLTDEAKAVAKEKGLEKPPAEEPECLRCHVAAYDVEKKTVPPKLKKEDGVQCENCHGAASLHVKDGKKRKMTKDMSIDMSTHIARPNEKTCKGCHNEDSPNYDPERYTLEDGTKVDFDFKLAWKQIAHGNPSKAKAAEK
ncbi:MAG: cytochrome C554 [Nitrospiraceae bacterium]|nr:cytochrome C554 [Nitrospiraceae bacterium]